VVSALSTATWVSQAGGASAAAAAAGTVLIPATSRPRARAT